MPPENPWQMRQKISDEKPVLLAQPMEASVKNEMDSDEQPPDAENARQKPGQWDRDDLGNQISRLDPAHLIFRYAQRALDGRKRRHDHLGVEQRHEHADAHHGKAAPQRNASATIDNSKRHESSGMNTAAEMVGHLRGDTRKFRQVRSSKKLNYESDTVVFVRIFACMFGADAKI